MEAATVASRLEAVTVYAEGAVCTRKLALAAELPDERVRVTGLPLSLQPGSLRAWVVRGPEALRVLEVRAGYDVQLPTASEEPVGALAALEVAREKRAVLELEAEQVARELETISGLRPAFPARVKGQPAREPPVHAVLALADFVDAELAALHARRLALEPALRDARDEVELREQRLREASSEARTARTALHRSALLTLSQRSLEGGAELALEYLVPGARWVPTYELRLDRTMAQGSLRMRASVAQRSGEDWRDVRLSLSTARLARTLEVPELRSLRVGRTQPPPAPSGWRAPPPGLEELFEGHDQLRGAPQPARQKGTGLGGPMASYDGAPAAYAVAGPREMASFGGAGAGASVEDAELDAPPMFDEGAPMLAATAPAAFSEKTRSLRAGPPPPPGAPPPAPSRSEKKRRARAAMAEREEAKEELAPHEPRLAGGTEPEESLLDYDALVLPGPEEPGRGRLTPAPAFRELQILASTTVRVEVLVSLVEQVRGTVNQLSRLPLPPHGAQVREAAGSFDYRYDAEHRVEVASDGAWHGVPVMSADVGLSPEYVTVPSVESRVYRTLKLHNRSVHALLAGPVDITLGDEFLMTAPLPTVAPGGHQRVGLGVEEALKVARNTRYEEKAGGLLGGSNLLVHDVEIELVNGLSGHAPVLVQVQERVPVASEKDLQVEESPARPPWQRVAPEPGEAPVEGARAWHVTLGPGERKQLVAQYVVRMPAGKMLVGGNRRV